MLKIFETQIVRFLLVGVLNTVFGASVMFIFYNVAGFSYWISSACNYVAGGILSFFLNKIFTFKNSEKSFKQIFVFALNLLVCYFVAYIAAKKIIYFVFDDFEISVKDNISMLCGMCLYTVLNFIGQKMIVFRGKK